MTIYVKSVDAVEEFDVGAEWYVCYLKRLILMRKGMYYFYILLQNNVISMFRHEVVFALNYFKLQILKFINHNY